MSKRMDENLYQQIKFMFAGGCKRKTISAMLCVSYSRVCRVITTNSLEEYQKKAAPEYRVNTQPHAIGPDLYDITKKVEAIQQLIEGLRCDIETVYRKNMDSDLHGTIINNGAHHDTKNYFLRSDLS